MPMPRSGMSRASALFSLFVALAALIPAVARERWSQQQARDWYQRQPWILGANYIPAA